MNREMNGRDAPSVLPQVLLNTAVLLLLGGAACAVTLWKIGPTAPVLRGAVAAALASPFFEYCIHRFISHGRIMFMTKPTAAVLKRIHYDHHQNPANPAVLMGTLRHIIGGSVMFSIPLGWLVGGPQGIGMAVGVGLIHAGLVEFIHANAHVPFLPEWRYLRFIRTLHLLHHFRNETVNYGVTSPAFDLLFRSYGRNARELPRSVTARNLGYGPDEARRFPWLAELNRRQSPFGVAPRLMGVRAEEHEGGSP